MELLTQYFHNVWHILIELAPWLMLGMLIAGILHTFLPEGFIARHLGKRRWTGVLKAVAIGVPMPLCSCGVIPAAVGLKKDGASDGAATGFLISTPQTGVDSILVSATFLGWPFAVFKVLAALVSGMIGGLLVNLFDHNLQLQTPNPWHGHSKKSGHEDVSPTSIPSCCCHNDPPKNKTSPRKKRTFYEMLHFAFIELLRDIYLWLIIGVLIAAGISTAVPENALKDVAWTQGLPGMLVMLAISIPMYICATASVPLAASLIAAGMSPGSALVLLMAGPVTNIATIGAVFRTFGRRILAIYMLTVIVSSITLGLTFDSLLTNIPTAKDHMHAIPGWLAIAAAIALIALLAAFTFTDLAKIFETQKPSCCEHKTTH